jgi:hypothetical protein
MDDAQGSSPISGWCSASNAESLETISASLSKPIAYAEVVEACATTSADSANGLAASSRTSGSVSALELSRRCRRDAFGADRLRLR